MQRQLHYLTTRADRQAGRVFVLPAVLIILLLSIFPLVASLSLSFSRLRFVRGGFTTKFVGVSHYRKLLFGTQKKHFLGVFADPSPVGWLIFAVIAALLVFFLVRSLRRERFTIGRFSWRVVTTVVVLSIVLLLVQTVNSAGRPGTLGVTLIYVFVGIFFQYLLGLGLALLAVQRLPGRRFFRTVFLLPMMITPVGIAYLFRMLTDTDKGPLNPIWQGLGLANFSWVTNPWGARAAVMIGDLWQWTPFMFIVLLAALESRSTDQLEAAWVDGANRWQSFRYITVPQILPVSATLILIRMIEAFKIVDLPNILTNGGPGTATESMTLHSFFVWRTLDVGGSAAIAYMLLFVVTLIALSYFNLIYSKVMERR
ncbi:MAG: carbohydrate ABC transporter permease [Candidatus Bipolaricaulia bacterium]